MITLNSVKIEQNHFPDHTLLVKAPSFNSNNGLLLTWHYENDAELFTVICLREHYKSMDMSLIMPYCPHARMDRVKNSEDVFTLKHFANILNGLNFKQVFITDPHSNVCTALINNVQTVDPIDSIQHALNEIIVAETNNIGHEYRLKVMKNLTMFYPDEGAMKRYSGMINHPYAFGIKKRDWSTGQILGLDIINPEAVKDKNILIIDDICSKGGTFFHSAKALKAAGAKNIYLYITHCEQSIFDGDLYTSGLLEHIYTTDSIYQGGDLQDLISIV